MVKKWRDLAVGSGQMEDSGAHGEDIPTAKKGRACPAGASGPSADRTRLLVEAAS